MAVLGDGVASDADYIEPNRKILPGLSEIRRTAFGDMDKAMILILQNTLSYLKEKDASVDLLTQETYEYYTQSENIHKSKS